MVKGRAQKKNLISIRKMFEHRIKNKSDLILVMHCIRHKFAIYEQNFFKMKNNLKKRRKEPTYRCKSQNSLFTFQTITENYRKPGKDRSRPACLMCCRI